MASEQQSTLFSSAFNLPNCITWTRLVLSVLVFAALSQGQFIAAFVLFLVAASTDWMDGYFARKYGLVTVLGRILDPFVDKIIICGTFIYLAAIAGSGIMPWMTVVIVGRELLVTVLRSMIEGQGGDFSANQAGKWKMVLQCAAALSSMLLLAMPDTEWLAWTVLVIVWGAVLLTIYSGAIYVQVAARQLR